MSPPVAVLVCAYGREPVKLRAVAVVDHRVEVIGDQPNPSIRLAAADVFRFDNRLFTRLQDEFHRGDRNRLAALWEEAVPFVVANPAKKE